MGVHEACRNGILLEGLAAHPTEKGYNTLGAQYAAGGDFVCAIPAFKAALAFNPKSSKTHYNLALALEGNGSLAAAAEEYKAAIDIDPRFGLALYNLGQLLSSQKRFQGAIFYFKQGLGARPPADLANQMKLALALAFAQSEDYASSIPLFEELAALRPDDSEIHFDLATAYAHHEEYPKAVDEYQEVLRLDPHRDDVRMLIAKALLNSSQVLQSIPYLQDYVRGKPDDPARTEVYVGHCFLPQPPGAFSLCSGRLCGSWLPVRGKPGHLSRSGE